MSEPSNATLISRPPQRGRRLWPYAVGFLVAALVAVGVASLLINIATRKQEERTPFARLVEVSEVTTDPAPWGINWPREMDGYQRTVDVTQTRYGGSSAIPEQKLESQPWLRRMYAGYAFSLDYRQRRGHAYMLHDQQATERVTQRPQPGACLHCHASVVATWRRLGLAAEGKPTTAAALAADFDWPAVQRGFELMSTMSYGDARAELSRTPDGTEADDATEDRAHPVSCVDCHDPDTMAIRVTRPGFVRGIAALAAGPGDASFLPSVVRWREGGRAAPYDPNADATRQEMRIFVCAQCHVEYYCGPKTTLFFPWAEGLRADDIERTYGATRFPDGEPFYDWKHGETDAPLYKAQHPEFELWSQGTHARAGVACADCHMPYVREGAMKVSDHWIRSPLLMINRSCQTCHRAPEQELSERVAVIQARTASLLDRAAVALGDMLDAIGQAKAAGAAGAELERLHVLQRAAQWRVDFVSSENSMGFHADQESARLLGEAIDYMRQAESAALALRAPPPLPVDHPREPVYGVTPADKAPPGPHQTR